MDKIAVGKRLRRHREKLGFSREQFAEQMSLQMKDKNIYLTWFYKKDCRKLGLLS